MDKRAINLIPVRDRKKLRVMTIKSFYKSGHTMDQIVEISKRHPELFYGTSGLSKTTVFYAVNRRAYPKKVALNT